MCFAECYGELMQFPLKWAPQPVVTCVNLRMPQFHTITKGSRESMMNLIFCWFTWSPLSANHKTCCLCTNELERHYLLENIWFLCRQHPAHWEFDAVSNDQIWPSQGFTGKIGPDLLVFLPLEMFL